MESDARNPVLEELIVAAPDEDSLKLVYGDWLHERGNQWGELIALQTAKPPTSTPLFEWDDPGGIRFGITNFSAGRPESWPDENRRAYESSLGHLRAQPPALDPQSREKTLRDNFVRECFGTEVVNPLVRVRWRCGFIDGVFIPQHSIGQHRLEDALIGLLEHPVAMALGELGIGELDWKGQCLDYDSEIDVLAVLAPPTLRRLVIGAWNEHDISWTNIRDLERLYPSLPGLESLELQAGEIEFGQIALPSLTNLLVRSGGLSESAIHSLQYAKCPELKSLTIWFGSDDYGGSDSAEVAEAFLAVGPFPKLRTLGLANAVFTDELCERLPKAAILPQLKTLDLSLGTMSAAGAKILIQSRKRFAHLDQINLRSNAIPKSLHEELSTLCPNVDLRYQKSHTNRYVTVSE